MSADAAKKCRLEEPANSSPDLPKVRNRLVNRDVLLKVFRLFHDIKSRYSRQKIDALGKLFVLNQLGHRYVVQLLQSVTGVVIDDYCYAPACRLFECNAALSDACTAEFFRMHLLNPRSLTISREARGVLPAISCIELYVFYSSSCPKRVTSECGVEMARIVNLSAKTLKKLWCFPADCAHLLNSDAFNLDEFSLAGKLPEGYAAKLPRTEMYDDSDHAVVPTHAHLLRAKKLCYSGGLHGLTCTSANRCHHAAVSRRHKKAVVQTCKPEKVNRSCPHVEEIVVHENCLWVGNWAEALKQLRQVFPNWRHLKIDMEIDVNDPGTDYYFKQTAKEWSDAFEEHLRHDTAPLRIDVSLANEGHFHAADLPKFKLDVEKDVRVRYGTKTSFTFTRNEDFGEGPYTVHGGQRGTPC